MNKKPTHIHGGTLCGPEFKLNFTLTSENQFKLNTN